MYLCFQDTGVGAAPIENGLIMQIGAPYMRKEEVYEVW
jgi:hypothetical protein